MLFSSCHLKAQVTEEIPQANLFKRTETPGVHFVAPTVTTYGLGHVYIECGALNLQFLSHTMNHWTL